MKGIVSGSESSSCVRLSSPFKNSDLLRYSSRSSRKFSSLFGLPSFILRVISYGPVFLAEAYLPIWPVYRLLGGIVRQYGQRRVPREVPYVRIQTGMFRIFYESPTSYNCPFAEVKYLPIIQNPQPRRLILMRDLFLA